MSADPEFPEFPEWLMLERFVFRREGYDDNAFPDGTFWVRGKTSWGLDFRVGLWLARPPLVSRLYAQLQGYPEPPSQVPLVIMATHRHLLLLRVSVRTPAQEVVQDFFIFNAHRPTMLQALHPCFVAGMDYIGCDGRPSRRLRPVHQVGPDERHLLTVFSMGLLCRQEHDEFAVAELKLFKESSFNVYADICLLRATTTSSGNWAFMRLPILGVNSDEDAWQLRLWQTNTVIPFRHCLCWIDYYRGILFLDVFRDPIPTVSFLRLPLDHFPSTPIRTNTLSWMYRCASTINAGHEQLMFVNVTRHDGVAYGPLKSGASFTITCHTLNFDSKVWNKEYMLTSDELWSANPADCLPRQVLMFPQVNMNRPHVLHFLITTDYKYVMKKMRVLTIDINTKAVKSVSQYINGREGLQTTDADLTSARSGAPMSFLPCEFSRFLHSARRRKLYR